MRYLLTFSIGMLAYIFPAFSQDTTYLFLNKGKQKCNKDTAYYYGIVYKNGDLWSRKDFWVKGNVLEMEGNFLDQACKTGQGTFNWYRENGTLKTTIVYERGKKRTADYFYESGKKKGHISYMADGNEQKGWDVNGNEIPGYIVEKPATFPGGPQGWRSYLEHHLKRDVAATTGARPGTYTVKVQFVVDKDGKVNNVQATDVPEACSRCGDEAVRVIKNGPKWEPAVQDNQPVIYQGNQRISFQVAP